MTLPDDDFVEKIWFIAKAVYIGVILFFLVLVSSLAIVFRDPNALIGLIFPIMMIFFGLLVWVASKLYDNKG